MNILSNKPVRKTLLPSLPFSVSGVRLGDSKSSPRLTAVEQAQRMGHPVQGVLHPVEGSDPRCRYYRDSEGNLFILRYGVLTIISASGRIY